ncbi:MAG TPA: 2-oxo acid dehydrogenase subunit E2 [Nocardioides sp.]|uniref:2-oxo acid dehydrogenase subunit E2 n=1 Tax=Nocardioides sp. TaxID=35761 RepID=UPI002B83317D|nr:2-oxo acid dehydrogenase subunit E2 [Nocardioides sp.]HTW13870.1 2-oxo acid dehydrogenase subunit E2 [Nocardioides sp.]
MAEFTMPSLGADMDEGTLLEWCVSPGDTVRRGDIMAVVDTSKAAVEVESFRDGVVDTLLVEPGTCVAVGAPMATLTEPDDTAPPAPSPAGSPKPRTVDPLPPEEHPRPAPPVRHLAHELGVDLATITGSGPGGRVTRDDVVQAGRPAAQPEPTRAAPAGGTRITPYARRLAAELGVDLVGITAPADGVVRAADVRSAAGVRRSQAPSEAPGPSKAATERHARMRATIASVMTRSAREIPHYHLTWTVDLHAVHDAMTRRNRDLPVDRRLVPAAYLLRATALAAAEVPGLNGFWSEGRLDQQSTVHLGIAVSLRGGGLVAPAIHDAATLTTDQLMSALRDVVERARRGRLRDAELRDPTITVTNLGDLGAESVHGVIYPPQVALVGFGRIVERPWAVDGLIGVRPVTTMTLAADHRATDGFVGSRFLAAIDHHLQRPEDL